MRLAYRFSFLWTAALATLATSLAAQVPQRPSIEVGEPVHVSAARPEVPHVEPYLAAHPDDADVLVGAAVTLPEGLGETTRVDVFRSGDGGETWEPVEAPGCSIDPWLDFDAAGNVHLVCLGEGEGRVLLVRSVDGGRTWVEPVPVPGKPTPGGDRPVLGVGRSSGEPDSGPVHIAFGQYLEARGLDRRVYGPALATSTDSGASFADPVLLVHDNLEQQPIDIEVLSEGTVAVMFMDYAYRSPKGQTLLAHRRVWLTRSRDRGETWSIPLLLHEQRHDEMPWSMAVDVGPRFRDRLHVVVDGFWKRTYPEPGEVDPSGLPALFLVSSDDAGTTWSEPVEITDGPPWANAETPAVAVNRDGVVGVAWYDTRHDRQGRCFDLYFSASVDGGRTFLPNVRVTPETSCPRSIEEQRGPARRWAFGGDYSGLAAGADGTFHLFWADSRSGLYQVWSSAVRVGAPAP